MSDQSQGQGWWLASDGKWYPPELNPAALPTTAPSGATRPLYRKPWFIVTGSIVALLILASVVGGGKKSHNANLATVAHTTSTQETSAASATIATVTTAAATTVATVPPTTTAPRPTNSPTTKRAPVYVPPPTQAPPPSPAAGTCTATMGNQTPGAGGSNSVTVHSNVANTPGTITMHYKTTDHPYSVATDGNGTAFLSFSMGRPTPGYTVTVDVDLSGKATCSTSFTPR
ncbi:MAG: hypothetical protein JWO37_742 [Acidimicrobiales bacterium]|jgi:hypothetical protein|nr:hypothetical protein [Acidimicrobiales bacterium]